MNIRELPIKGAIKDKFLSFSSLISGFDKLRLEGCCTAKMLEFNGYEDVAPICSVCGHGLKNVVIYKHTETGDRYGVGVVCASNINALQRNDIDKLNYERTVRLERKTIMKRMLEFMAAQGKIDLEVKHNEKMLWLYELVEISKEQFGHLFEIWLYSAGNNDYKEIFNNELRFFYSIYNQVMKKGKLSEKQINALQTAMKKMDIDQRLDSIDNQLKKLEIELLKRKLIEDAVYRAEKVRGLWNARQGDKEFMKSLCRFYDDRGYLTEKQISAANTIYDRYFQEDRA